MGKIFGISDNPVSTIESSLKGMYRVEAPKTKTIGVSKNQIPQISVQTNGSKISTSPFGKIHKGFGKLLSHFNKTRIK